MPQLAVPEFQSTLAQLASLASSDVVKTVLTVLDRLSQPEGLSFITDAYPTVLERYLRASSDLSLQWYSEQPAKNKLFTPEPVPLIDRKRLGASARWAMLRSDPAGSLSGSALRSVFDQSRMTVLENAKSERIRYARYASATACGWCRMLATRGAVYGTKADALKSHGRGGNMRSHDVCKCLAVPVRDGVYDEPPYVEQWRRDYNDARDKVGGDGNAIAREMNPARRKSAAQLAKAQAKDLPSVRDLPPIDLDAAAAEVAARQLPALEATVAKLRAAGVPESDERIAWNNKQIARLTADMRPLSRT